MQRPQTEILHAVPSLGKTLLQDKARKIQERYSSYTESPSLRPAQDRIGHKRWPTRTARHKKSAPPSPADRRRLPIELSGTISRAPRLALKEKRSLTGSQALERERREHRQMRHT